MIYVYVMPPLYTVGGKYDCFINVEKGFLIRHIYLFPDKLSNVKVVGKLVSEEQNNNYMV